MTRPSVSVIAAVYNAESYLNASLPPLIDQVAAVGGELIIIDDGSEDGSLAIARELGAGASHVRIVRLQANVGVARARLRGAKEASGRFVWFVDVDDEWDDRFLSTALSIASDAGADVAVVNAVYQYPDGSTRPLHQAMVDSLMSGEDALRALLEGRLKGHLWNKVFSTELVRAMSIDPSSVHSDLSMAATLLASARHVRTSDEVLYRYVVRPGSIIQSGRPRYDSLMIVERMVRRAAAGLEIPDSLLEDFVHRFFLLSAIKDSFNNRYTAERARLIRRTTRQRISLPLVLTVTSRTDKRRALALLVAKLAPAALPFVVSKM